MSHAIEVIERARDAGITLALEGGELTAEGPAEVLRGLVPSLKAHKPEILRELAGLAEARTDPDEVSGHWLISLPPERLERWFSPAVTRAELETRYPRALLVALPDTTEPPSPHLLESLP